MSLCYKCGREVKEDPKLGQFRCASCGIFIELHQVVDSEKHANFERVQLKRIPNITKQLQLLQNGAKGASYDFGPVQIEEIFAELDLALNNVKRVYMENLRKKKFEVSLRPSATKLTWEH